MSQQAKTRKPEEPGNNFVDIVINSNLTKIHRGRQTVREIKSAGGIAQADVLNQILGGKLQPLGDDDALVLKGAEEFVSHPRDSASS